MTKIIIINGMNGVGKDETVKMFRALTSFNVVNVSTADVAKDILHDYAGWKGEKDERTRLFLSDLIDLMWKHKPEMIFRDIDKRIPIDTNGNLVFIHCREPDNIKKLSDIYHVKTLHVRNNRCKPSGNHADQNTENYDYDFHLDNHGSFDDLKDNILKLLDSGILK